VAELIVLGEAPPPERFFYFGDSLFFRYTQRAFAALLPEVETRDAGWFLALFCGLGGWRIDVCDAPRRPTRGGAEDVSDCLAAFEARWAAQPRDPEALVIVSPKRLVAALPAAVRREVVASVPPPGQWNAHRQAFLRELPALLERHLGRGRLRAASRAVDPDDAALDFEIARACAEGAEDAKLRRLLRGHPREAALLAALEQGE
jgi:hypothetical protein